MKVKLILLCVLMMGIFASGSVYAVPVLWDTDDGGNGHYYEIVLTDSMNWDAANSFAMGSTYMGYQGHLATITSSEENYFISYNEDLGNGSIDSIWLGGYQLDGSVEPDGGWQWVTDEDFDYANWHTGEPNNSPAGENRLVFQHGWNTDGKEWNDLTGSWLQRGYVVEYEASSAPVPEPSTIFLLCTGLVTLVGGKFRRKRS